MPRFARLDLPVGFSIIEHSDGTYQAVRESTGERSTRYARRRSAILWCLQALGREASAASA
jgi:hypothetical protein